MFHQRFIENRLDNVSTPPGLCNCRFRNPQEVSGVRFAVAARVRVNFSSQCYEPEE